MATIRERLVYAIDFVTDGRSLNQLQSKTSSVFTQIKANAGALAIGAGAAIATFGVKAVAAFQDTALAAGKFSDATKLSVEDASRWIEVASDVGVSAETIQGAFVKLNKELADGSPVADRYSLSLKTTADGAVDVNATMLEAIRAVGAIVDPTERAAAAQQLFGRSYAEAAEIIFDSADNVAAKLGEVGDAQVVDEAELAKARELRESLDELGDRVQALAIGFGEYLVPAVVKALEGIEAIGNVLEAAGIDDVLDGIGGGAENVAQVNTELQEFNRLMEEGSSSNAAFANAFGDLVEAEGKATGGLEAFTNVVGAANKFTEDHRLEIDAMRDAFGKLAEENPEAAGQVIKSLQAVAKAAENGNDTAQQWVDKWGLSDQVIEDLISDLYKQVGATDAAGDSADAATGEMEGLAGGVTDVANALKSADPAWRAYTDAISGASAEAQGAPGTFEDMERAVEGLDEAMADAAAEGIAEFQQAIEDAAAAIEGKFSEFEESLDLQDLLIDIADQVDKVNEAAEELGEGGEAEARNYRREVGRLQGQVKDLLRTYEDIPPQKITEILTRISQGDVNEILRVIDELTKDRFIRVGVVVPDVNNAYDSINTRIGNGAPSPIFINPNPAPAIGTPGGGGTSAQSFVTINTLTSTPAKQYVDRRIDDHRNGVR